MIDADLAARASELAATEANISKREKAHKADVADAAQVLEREHAAIRRAKLADRKAREDKAAELADKEANIAYREAELINGFVGLVLRLTKWGQGGGRPKCKRMTGWGGGW